MAVLIPTRNGRVLLLDVGAHAEADTVQLAQSAALAHAYLKVVAGLNRPRVGLLNIGRELTKGLDVIRRAFTLLERSNLNFVGNVEPEDIFAGRTDAVICDGFTGNILLKTCEGISEALLGSLEAGFSELDERSREFFRKTLHRSRLDYHYERIGGAPLLGARKTVVVAHGRSSPSAIANAIGLTCRLAQAGIFERVAAELEQNSILTDLKHSGGALMLENLKNKWGFTQK
jgi:glycerol-3-phosphate acyltransferase PlsX